MYAWDTSASPWEARRSWISRWTELSDPVLGARTVWVVDLYTISPGPNYIFKNQLLRVELPWVKPLLGLLGSTAVSDHCPVWSVHVCTRSTHTRFTVYSAVLEGACWSSVPSWLSLRSIPSWLSLRSVPQSLAGYHSALLRVVASRHVTSCSSNPMSVRFCHSESL